MKKRILSALLVVICVASSVLAQDYSFKVITGVGNNTSNGAALKTGAKITKDATIKVEKYLALGHNSNATLEIKTAGEYKASDLEKKITSSSLSSRYGSYVIGELTGNEEASRQSRMSGTGSVERALTGASYSLTLPEQSSVFEVPVVLKWDVLDKTAENVEQLASNKEFVVIAQNIENKEIFRQEVSGNSITLDLSKEPFVSSRSLIRVRVYSKSNPEWHTGEEFYGLKKLNPKKPTDLEIQNTFKELAANNTALGKIVLAQFCEESGLYANARTAYEEALAIIYTDDYQAMYDNFIARMKKSDNPESANKE